MKNSISHCSINLGGSFKHIEYDNTLQCAKIYFSSQYLTEEEINSLPFDTSIPIEEFNKIYETADFKGSDTIVESDKKLNSQK